MFSWLATSDYFRELNDADVRHRMYLEQKEQIEADMAPFGFMDDGINEHEENTVDEYGTVWHPVTRKGL
jgi:hypothetical protein